MEYHRCALYCEVWIHVWVLSEGNEDRGKFEKGIFAITPSQSTTSQQNDSMSRYILKMSVSTCRSQRDQADVEDCESLQSPHTQKLNLYIRIREMAHSRSPSRSGYNNKASDDEDVDPGQSPLTSLSHSLHSIPSHSPIHEIRSHQPCSTQLSMQFSQIPTHRLPLPTTEAPPLPLPTDHVVNTYMVGAGPQQQHPDLFHPIRKFNIGTKTAWIAIPTHEGFKAVETCRSLSATGSGTDGSQLPCYNREMIYDEEWQKHMKDVHGVFLLWPETWVKRIEVLDLDAVGGEIESCNDLIMGWSYVCVAFYSVGFWSGFKEGSLIGTPRVWDNRTALMRSRL